MSDERFNEILKQKFDFGRYVELDSDNNVNNTGQEISEEIKKIVKSLKLVSMTECGAELLENLDLKQKIKVTHLEDIKDEKGNIKSGLGESTGNYEIIIYDAGVNRGEFSLATTLMHELTHEYQKQNGIYSVLCNDHQNAFMMNKLVEADARLKTAEFAIELYQHVNKKEGEDRGKEVVNQMEDETWRDMNSYAGLTTEKIYELLEKKEAPNNEEIKKEVRREMLKEIYKDEKWSTGYNEQALRAADIAHKYEFGNYNASMMRYRDELRENHNNPKDIEMFEKMMSQVGLKKEDAEYFANPENISSFPAEEFARRYENKTDGNVQAKTNLRNSLSGVSCTEVSSVEQQNNVNVAQIAMNNTGGR